MNGQWTQVLPFRYNPFTLHEYIEKVSKVRKKATFRNYKVLKEGINRDRNSIRRGQFIYGAMNISDFGAPEFLDRNTLIRSLFLLIKTGVKRKVPSFHVAVYVGKHNNAPYVVENPPSYGFITLQPLESAFHMLDGPMFVVSPIRDNEGKSTGHQVVQPALASSIITMSVTPTVSVSLLH